MSGAAAGPGVPAIVGFARRAYLDRYRAVVRELRERWGEEVDVEPVVATGAATGAEGAAAFGPSFGLELRLDCVYRDGSGALVPVAALLEEVPRGPGAGGGAPVEVPLENGGAASVAPFRWEECRVRVHGAADFWEPLADWFGWWFDPEGEREPDADGLHGVVHSLEEPRAEGGATVLTIDFGSAPAGAFHHLLRALARLGAARVEVGDFD